MFFSNILKNGFKDIDSDFKIKLKIKKYDIIDK